MMDKWMNIGYDDDPLKPYVDSAFDDKDNSRLGMQLTQNIDHSQFL